MTVASEVTANVQFFSKNNIPVSKVVPVTIAQYNNKSKASVDIDLFDYPNMRKEVLKDNPNDYVLRITINQSPDNKYIYVGANNFQINRNN